MIIAVFNNKGGVGKTTTSLTLGVALSTLQRNVLLCDLDLQRDLWDYAEELGNERLSIEKEKATSVKERVEKKDFDFAILDCPPSLGEEAATALKIATHVLVPVAAEFPAVKGLARVLDTIKAARKVNPKLKTLLVVTMMDRRSEHGAVIETNIRSIPAVKVMDSVIPRSLQFARASGAGQTILQFAPKSPGANAYRTLAEEILNLDNKHALTAK